MRWSIAAVVLMIAGVIAIWPREQPAPTQPSANVTQATPDLADARAKAALPACPAGAEGPADLRGITAECLADGSKIDLATALRGPVLVNVWATWCAPCKTELPVLDAYAKEPGAVPVLTLGVQSKPADALELLTVLKIKLPSLLDEDGRALRKLRLAGLPASYLVSDGTVTPIKNPPVFETVDQVRQAVHG